MIEYKGYGHFYKLEKKGKIVKLVGNYKKGKIKLLKSSELLRSVLDIINEKFFEIEMKSNAEKLLKSIPDAIFIMQNPGSSKPNEECMIDTIKMSEYKDKLMNKTLIECGIDPTHENIIEIMNSCGLSHVRILNLSDICWSEGGEVAFKIRAFKKKFKKHNYVSHSIFSEQRKKELETHLSYSEAKTVYYIMASGETGKNDPLKENNDFFEKQFPKISRNLISVRNYDKGYDFHPNGLYYNYNEFKWSEIISNAINLRKSATAFFKNGEIVYDYKTPQ